MTKLLTNNFNTYMAQVFKETFEDSANNHYYIFAARSLPWENESTPPSPDKTIKDSYYDIFDQMLFGKKIKPENVYQVVKNKQWEENVVYDMYTPTDPLLDDKNFFVVTHEGAEYTVFKCLFNNGGVASTDEPKKSETSADDEFYQTNDGYVWKYMYTIPESIYNDYATDQYIPVLPDAEVTANSVPGAIDVFVIEDGGANYNSYANGTIKESSLSGNSLFVSIESETTLLSGNTDFYKNNSIYIRSGRGAGQIRNITEYIVSGNERRVLIDRAFSTVPDTTSVFEICPRVIVDGDGEGIEAVATVNATSNSIHSIEIINRGQDYTFANTIVVANSGILDTESNNYLAESAKVSAIIGPEGGHGSNTFAELYSSSVIISQEFSGTEGDTISVENDYRKIGLLKNPLFANTVLTVSDTLGFEDGQTLTQNGTVVGEISAIDADGVNTIRVKNIHGQFLQDQVVVSSNSTMENIASTTITAVDRDINTFNQTQTLSIEMTYLGPQGGGFIEDEKLIQASTSTTAHVNEANTSILTLSNVKGNISVSDDISGEVQTITGETSGAIAKITGKILGDINDGKGDVLYVENMEPVSRQTDQSERIKLIVDF